MTLADDRALLGIHEYDPDLSLWQFNVTPASGSERLPAAAAVFTERGIYRPGEPVYAKAIAGPACWDVWAPGAWPATPFAGTSPTATTRARSATPPSRSPPSAPPISV